MPFLQIFEWSDYSTSSLSTSTLETSSHTNDPAVSNHDPSNQSWIGETLTFNGGTPTTLDINDDDGSFDDAYVETGDPQTLNAPVTINGVTYAAGSVVQNEFSMLDAAGREVWVVRINNTNVGMAYANGDRPESGETFTVAEGRDGAPEHSSDQTSSSSEPYQTIVCYAAGTLIETPLGPRRVETLAPGDRVLTADHGPQPVRWLRDRALAFPHGPAPQKPILIRAGAMGGGLPRRDLVVSPQHRMVLPGADGRTEVLVPAKALTCLPGVRPMNGCRRIRYIHFLLDRHAVVRAEGAQSESLLPGPWVLQSLPPRERAEVMAVIARARRDLDVAAYAPCRPVLTVRQTRALLMTRQRLPGWMAA